MPKLKLISSVKPFANRWLTLYVNTLLHSNGLEQSYTYIVRRHQGVVIIPYFSKSDSLLLVSQYRHPIQKKIWQLPGGGQEPGLSPAAAVKLELLEETGYRVDSLISLGRLYPDAGIIGNRGYVYLAANPLKEKSPGSPDRFEHIKAKIFTRDQVENMIQTSQIRDGWTLSAYLLLILYLHDQTKH
jgi:8-oxo-dGTP pyrophosphatase MutT (NUDIX family)